ncbi:lethal 87Df [Culex quinquefasciatus]|uniref:Cytochrome c oxidase assembly protein COX20, mitochondrial n=2 Tax=Culex pipiens complex TaxID=518105 RepID=B0WBN7_CULQU|nr:cytochrome c oxidase assembly protein COX20, mitochondrial [Culex quinquefasciatus]XP_039429188.1 cytochrome c oxidase assembly protein COX20, mitochondrial [Culex pipiens pallens]EDS42572.1 lethal 87Df [Culex quinquefasciatus]|eukprot:XP_001846121.1 lethal 87Df [Culex quinquefasciatus]
MTDKKKVDFDALQADSPPARSLTLFGRDLSQMPCFRNSFLYGISLGMAVGFLAFMKTSRPQMSTHIGFGTFVGTTLCYWFPCRYNWSKQQREADMLQHLMQQQAMYEGSAKERELDQKAERA